MTREETSIAYETILNNVAASPGNDQEIDALRDLLDEAWKRMRVFERVRFLQCSAVKDIAAKAEQWAKDQNDE